MPGTEHRFMHRPDFELCPETLKPLTLPDRHINITIEGKPIALDAVTLGIVKWAVEHRDLFQLPRFRGSVAVEFHVDTERASLTVHPRIAPDT